MSSALAAISTSDIARIYGIFDAATVVCAATRIEPQSGVEGDRVNSRAVSSPKRDTRISELKLRVDELV